MKETNAERIVYKFLSGNYYYSAKDKMNLRQAEQDVCIYYKNTLLGHFEEDEVDGKWLKFLILPLQDFKSDKGWKRAKLSLCKAVNELSIRVIFIDNFDFGFKGDISESAGIHQPSELYKKLIYVAKYSQNDLKNATLALTQSFNESKSILTSKIEALTFNQFIDNKWVTPEQILLEYFGQDEHQSVIANRWVSLIEPREYELSAIIRRGVSHITYAKRHGDSLNTPGYIQYTNDIFIGKVKSLNGGKILYLLNSDKGVDKFYDNNVRRS